MRAKAPGEYLGSSEPSEKRLQRDDFHYFVPDRQIAQIPLARRSDARLLVRKSDGVLHHSTVAQLTSELPPKSLLIINESRVLPVRLTGTLADSGGRIELLLVEPETDQDAPDSKSFSASRWLAIAKPLKKLKAGTRLAFPGNMSGKVVGRQENRVVVQFRDDDFDFLPWLERHGSVPLPPYITRAGDQHRITRETDRQAYQTIFAKHDGSSAAPTAGLHFTRELVREILAKGHEIASVILHVGPGTFLPVKTNSLADHSMHSERFLIPQSTLHRIMHAQQSGRAVIAVGTTTLRALEALERQANQSQIAKTELCDQWLRTNIFIYPRSDSDLFTPWAIDGLVTNFHQPHSTLLMLVSALIGRPQTLEMYNQAVEEGYRFFSYGDASLLWF